MRPATWSKSRWPLEVIRLPLSMQNNHIKVQFQQEFTTTLWTKKCVPDKLTLYQPTKSITLLVDRQCPMNSQRVISTCYQYWEKHLPLGILLNNVQSLQLLETVSGNGTTTLCKMRRSYTITLASTIDLTECTHSNSLPQVDFPCHRSLKYTNRMTNTVRSSIELYLITYQMTNTISIPENLLYKFPKATHCIADSQVGGEIQQKHWHKHISKELYLASYQL